MDLSTIKSRLDKLYYQSSTEAVEDFRLMFKNCYTYNANGGVSISGRKHGREGFGSEAVMMTICRPSLILHDDKAKFSMLSLATLCACVCVRVLGCEVYWHVCQRQ